MAFALVVGLLLLMGKKTTTVAAQAPSPSDLDNMYQTIAHRFGDDWRLLKAFALVESSENPFAVNAGDPSYGLMQIKSFWLVYFGFLNKEDPDLEAKAKGMLLDAGFSIDIGARILSYFRSRTNPSTLSNFRFPQEADIYNVGETLWARGVRNVPYRDKITREYQRLGAL